MGFRSPARNYSICLPLLSRTTTNTNTKYHLYGRPLLRLLSSPLSPPSLWCSSLPPTCELTAPRVPCFRHRHQSISSLLLVLLPPTSFFTLSLPLLSLSRGALVSLPQAVNRRAAHRLGSFAQADRHGPAHGVAPRPFTRLRALSAFGHVDHKAGFCPSTGAQQKCCRTGTPSRETEGVH